jgi:cyclopropane fatty-acyl-phospholipid synthase-like methyltransferase
MRPSLNPPLHAGTEPSDWLLRWAHLLPAGGRVLDLACGRGRPLRWAAARGGAVTATSPRWPHRMT